MNYAAPNQISTFANNPDYREASSTSVADPLSIVRIFSVFGPQPEFGGAGELRNFQEST